MQKLAYKITTDADMLDMGYDITEEMAQKIDECLYDLEVLNKPDIKKIKQFVRQYPNIPDFQSFLWFAYVDLDQFESAYRANDELLKKFPGYIFAKINKAVQFIENGQFDKVKIILGPTLKLEALYPERHIFHITEFMAFHETVLDYYLELADFAKAEEVVKLMRHGDPENPACLYAEERLLITKLGINTDMLKESMGNVREVKAASYDKSVQTRRQPKFYYKEVWRLYENGLDIDTSILQDILSLPPDELVNDLEAAVLDSIQRFDYYKEWAGTDEYEPDFLDFPLHAMCLLAELESEKSLPIVLEFLRQGREFLDFWVGDLLTEMMWQVILKLAHNSLPTLESFMCERNRFQFALAPVSSALLQMCYHHPEKKEPVTDVFRRVFDFFLQHVDDEDLIDSEVIASFISDTIEMRATVLLPNIENLFAHDIVASYICGSLDIVKEDIQREQDYKFKMPVFTIYEMYDYFHERWLHSEDDEDIDLLDDDDLDLFDDLDWSDNYDDDFDVPPNIFDQVGRNDPCPCGSGKKYKKCCWGKI